MLRLVITNIGLVIASGFLISSFSLANSAIEFQSKNASGNLSIYATTTHEVTYIGGDKLRAGERRFNENLFKVTHNAYEGQNDDQRKGSYATQIDDYNSWGIELDLYWENGQFEVSHNGCDGDSMDNHISQLARSLTWREKVIVLWLEIKQEGEWGHTDCPLPDPVIYELYIQSLVAKHFGWQYVYTSDEFKTIDQGKWPSWQELIRRGKNLLIVVQRPCKPDRDNILHQDCPHYPVYDWFFEVKEDENYDDRPNSAPTPGSYDWHNNIVFFNTGEFTHLPLLPLERADYWASRMYPDSWCEGSVIPKLSEERDEWETHVHTQATQVATNCLEREWTNGVNNPESKWPLGNWAIHPPQPTYVGWTFSGSITQYGTRSYPYWGGAGNDSYDAERGGFQRGLLGAIQRVAFYGTSVQIWIGSGDYDVNADGLGGITISKPMVFKKNPDSSGGVVVIR